LENEATVALPRAATKAPFPKRPRPETYSKKSASTPNVWVKAKLIWNPNNMFSYCLKLNTRNEIGTKKRSHGLLVPALNARTRTANVTRKQTCMRYISATLSYPVMRPNKNSTPLGKNILCSLCWAKKSDRLNVPEDHSPKIRTIDHASKKTTLTPNVRT